MNQFIIYILFYISVNAHIDYGCDFPSSTPQRVEWLDHILITSQQILSKYNIITWAVQSTLLGIVRDQHTMPWTWDVDLQTFSNNISHICLYNSPSHLELIQHGLRIYHCSHNFARICRAKINNHSNTYISNGEPIEARLDIYGATLRHDGFYDVTFSPCVWDLHTHLLPLQLYHWDNHTKHIYGPHNYHYWLQFSYGSNWNQVIKYGGGKTDICSYIPNTLHF